ncbi:MAG: hypothetical protein KF823_02540 [Xanthomonadales bacterium]|nr:hypothetical protein [Xanthomonadales bacterium]
MRIPRSAFFAILAAAVLTLAQAAIAQSALDAPRTLEQCAALLPPGQIYSFEITGSIDATGDAPVLAGQMSVSDGSEVDRAEETAAFQQCLASLIR